MRARGWWAVQVFWEFFQSIPDLIPEQSVASIFGNIHEILDVTQGLASLIEDKLDMVEQDDDVQYPSLGECFASLAEEHEFDVYDEYASNYPSAMKTLFDFLGQAHVTSRIQAEQDVHFLKALQFHLPRLLLEPIYHINHYFALVDLLIKTTPLTEHADRQNLRQAAVDFNRIKKAVHIPSVAIMTFASIEVDWLMPRKQSYIKFSKHTAFERQAKLVEIQATVGDWDSGDTSSSCGKFIREATVNVWADKAKKVSERKVFHFENMLIFCKPTASGHKVKERYPVRGFSAGAVADSGDVKNAFKLESPGGERMVVASASPWERDEWLAAIDSQASMRLIMTAMESKIRRYEADLPSLLPSQSEYEFAVPDSEACIRFEAKKSVGSPVIKGGTLAKLIERLTYPVYADLNYMRHFMTTYRSFCEPGVLLDYLIKRYKVPQQEQSSAPSAKAIAKQFHRTFVIPVKIRVVNVLKHWVEKHYYDFEASPALLRSLLLFIKHTLAPDPTTKKPVRQLTQAIKRRRASADVYGDAAPHAAVAPEHLWFQGGHPAVYHVLTLHPVETARQLTLIESELFRSIRPTELIGMKWSKAGKEQNARHVLQLIYRFNCVSNWVIRSIVETPNLEERADVVVYFLEVLRELIALNNFNGAMEVISALQNSIISRLHVTWQEVAPKRRKVLEDGAAQLSQDKNFKGVRTLLAGVEGPCVPFFGMYLSDITFIEEGSSDVLPLDPGVDPKVQTPELSGLINFGKRRLVAKTTGDIQQLQSKPYALGVEPEIRRYLLDFPSHAAGSVVLPRAACPKAAEESFTDQMYDKSKLVEPRGAQGKGDLPAGARVFDDAKAARARRDVVLSLASKRPRNSTSGARGSRGAILATGARHASGGSRPSSQRSSVHSMGADAAPPPRPPKPSNLG